MVNEWGYLFLSYDAEQSYMGFHYCEIHEASAFIYLKKVQERILGSGTQYHIRIANPCKIYIKYKIH